MTRLSLLLLVVLSACKPKAPASSDSRPGTGELVASTQPMAAPPGHVTQLPPPDPRERALSATILQLLEGEHLLHKKIDDKVSEIAFKTYLDSLDAGKMFLLQSDADALAKLKDDIDDELRSGVLAIAHDGAKVFQTRVAAVEKIVEKVLAQPLDLTNEEYIEIDPDKVKLAATEDELADRWRRRLELEVLERVAGMEARLEAEAARAKAKAEADKKAKKTKKKPADKAADGPADAGAQGEDDDVTVPIAQIPATPEGREAKAREDLAKTYAGRFARLKAPAQLDAAAELVNSVTAALDPHTTYLPPADKANFDIRMSGSLEGIGAVLREKDHLIEIVEVVPGGASWRHGGLATGDLILAVQQDKQPAVDVFDMRIDEVVKMIRGPKGTVVRLRIQKPTGQEETIAITRDVVVIEESYAKAALLNLKGKSTVGYIHLPSFYGGRGSPHSSGDDVGALLAEMKKRNVAGVILDIRSNGGGLLSDAIEISGHLIDQGPVVQVKDSAGQKEVLSDTKRGVVYDGPVIVMTDRFSASASEILSGALQDYGRAIIVGTGPTHGKGTVQTIADLDRMTGGQVELGVLKITIQQFFRPSGSSVQLEGVKPDVVLPDPAAYIDSGERELPQAIAWSKIEPAPFDHWGVVWSKQALAAKSAARVAKDPVLAKIAAATKVLRERRDDTKVPLQKSAWEARRKAQKDALEAASPDLKKQPAGFAVKLITESTAKDNPDGKKDDSGAKWRENLSHDPWLAETLHVMDDMLTTK